MSIIADRMSKIDSSGIRKVFNLAAKMKDPINLSIGQPDFDIPEVVKTDMIEAIETGYNKYTLTQGTVELREAILTNRFNSSYSLDNIIITSGVSGALLLSMMVLINHGDEVMMFDPYFVMYPHLTNLTGGVSKFIDMYPDFKITRDKLEKAYSPKVKLILANSPANPTGITLSKEEVKTLTDFAREKNLILISDEIYDSFVYDGDFVSPRDYYDNVLTLNGFSKNLGMTGLRLGYAVGPKEIIESMIKLQQYTFVCAPSIAQKGAEKHINYDFSEIREAYKRKRDIVYNSLSENFNLVKPTGAFYAFPRLKNSMSGDEFVAKAIENNVLIIPSSVFSSHTDGFRISFAAEEEKLKRGMDILNSIIK